MYKKVIGIVIVVMFFGAGVIPLVTANQVNLLIENETNNNDIGRYVLIYNQPVEAPETAQSPYAPVSAYQENENYPKGWDLYVYDNFWDINEEISKVVWWGMADNYDDGFIPGTPEGMNFKIEFYDDVPDQYYAPPIDLICSFDVTNENLIIIHTERIYLQKFELIRFEYELPSTLSITDGDGWISIWSYNDSEQDVFLWPRATEGDDFCYQKNGGPIIEWDASFQFYKYELDEPPDKPIITGEPNGKAGTEYNYTFVSNDPEEDNISYCIDWGDNTSEVCIGPFLSGFEASANHTWVEKGDYTIKVKARDTLGAESEYETLTVSMPKGKSYIPFGLIFVFGFDVEVKIVQLGPGEDYIDLEVLNKPLYIWEDEIQTRAPGEFIRLYNAKGLFLPSLSFCFGICDDWGIIG